MSRSRNIRISSNESTGTCNNFTTTFGGNTSHDLSHVKAVRFKYVSFNNSEYNVNSKNNVLAFNHSVAGLNTVTIPEGQYTINELITRLGVLISDAINPNSIAISQDSISGKIDISLPDLETIIIYQNGVNGCTAGNLIGVSETTSAFTEARMANIPNLSGLNILHIHSRQIGNGDTIISTEENDIARVNGFLSVPITVGYSQTQSWQGNDADIKYFDSEVNLQNIDISLRDGDGQLIECAENYSTEIGIEYFFD